MKRWYRGRNMKVRGSIKIWAHKYREQAHKLGWCIWMCISYVCLYGTSFKLKFHACMVYASYRFEWWNEKLACISGSSICLALLSQVELEPCIYCWSHEVSSVCGLQVVSN